MKHLSWDEAWELAETMASERTAEDAVLLHINECQTCFDRLEQAGRWVAAIRAEASLPAAVRQQADDDQLWKGISQRIGQQVALNRVDGVETQKRQRKVKKSTGWLSAAAALLICAAGWFQWNRVSSIPNTPVQLNSTMKATNDFNALKQGVAKPDIQSGMHAAGMAPSAHNGAAATSTARVGTATTRATATTVTGMVTVQVQGASRGLRHAKPLAFANVAILTQHGLVGSGRTNGQGSVTMRVTASTARWEGLDLGNLSHGAHGWVTVVAWKPGYTRLVEAGVALFAKSSRVTVTLEPSASGDTPQMDGRMAPLPRQDVLRLIQMAQTVPTPPAIARKQGVELHIIRDGGRPVKDATVAWLTQDGWAKAMSNPRGTVYLSAVRPTATPGPAFLPASVWSVRGDGFKDSAVVIQTAHATDVWVGCLKLGETRTLRLPAGNKNDQVFPVSLGLPLPSGLTQALWSFLRRG